ncbi:MAG: DUF4419 domain-containing protein [Opitutaceae bacterium]|jgi:hypothetical protein|nr:DUF4419 domain-containing protein [Opitutaceae bacterium]
MKKLLQLLLLLALPLSVPGQTGITFAVEELPGPKGKIHTSSSRGIYQHLVRLDAGMKYGGADSDKIDYHYNIIAQSKADGELVNFNYNSFFNGMYKAYADHRPFVLSPDMIWLLISQGFARHAGANPEKLRDRLVGFSGKLSLVVNAGKVTLDDPNSPWEEIFPEFTRRIAEHTGDNLIKTLTADFSTTTPVERVASEITIMEAMRSYFEFIVMRAVCGIPEITLRGTPEDWQKVLDKTRRLAGYDLEWWTGELEPLLKEFVNASKGNINKDFWRNMFKHHSQKQYGAPNIIDGWIVKFFPYDKHGKRNNLKELAGGDNLPEEIVKVDIKYVDLVTKTTTPLELWAGFIGLEQNDKNHALTPKIGWMIRKKDASSSALRQVMAQNDRPDEDGEREGIKIMVRKVPEALFDMGEISSLTIVFTEGIDIPDELARVKIRELTLIGKIDAAGRQRIERLFPNTKLHCRESFYEPPPPPKDDRAK